MADEESTGYYETYNGQRIMVNMPPSIATNPAARADHVRKEYEAGRYERVKTDPKAEAAGSTFDGWRRWAKEKQAALTSDVTNALGGTLGAVGGLGQGLLSAIPGSPVPAPEKPSFAPPAPGGITPRLQGGTMVNAGNALAGLVVPQSPEEQAVAAAVAGAPGLRALVTNPWARTAITWGMPIGAGATAGAALDAEPSDALWKSTLLTTLSNGGTAAINRGYKFFSAAYKRFLGKVDAKAGGEMLESIPELIGKDGRPLFTAKTAQEFDTLVGANPNSASSGFKRLGDAQDDFMERIASMVGPDAVFPSPKAPTKTVTKLVPRYDASGKMTYEYSEPNLVPIDQVRKDLHDMWYSAVHKADKAERREALIAYDAAKESFGAALTSYDKSGAAEGVYKAMNTQYRLGRNLLDLMEQVVKPAQGKSHKEPMLDLSKAQEFFLNHETRREWQSSIAPEAWPQIEKWVYRGAGASTIVDRVPTWRSPVADVTAAVMSGGQATPSAGYHGVLAMSQGPKVVGNVSSPAEGAVPGFTQMLLRALQSLGGRAGAPGELQAQYETQKNRLFK